MELEHALRRTQAGLGPAGPEGHQPQAEHRQAGGQPTSTIAALYRQPGRDGCSGGYEPQQRPGRHRPHQLGRDQRPRHRRPPRPEEPIVSTQPADEPIDEEGRHQHLDRKRIDCSPAVVASCMTEEAADADRDRGGPQQQAGSEARPGITDHPRTESDEDQAGESQDETQKTSVLTKE